MILGTEIPDPYLVAILVGILGLVAWIVRELGRISAANSVSQVVQTHLERKINDQEARLDRHEAWLDALRHPKP